MKAKTSKGVPSDWEQKRKRGIILVMTLELLIFSLVMYLVN